MHCDALGRMTAMVFQDTTAVLVNQYALPVANLGAPHAGELASQGLEAAGRGRQPCRVRRRDSGQEGDGDGRSLRVHRRHIPFVVIKDM